MKTSMERSLIFTLASLIALTAAAPVAAPISFNSLASKQVFQYSQSDAQNLNDGIGAGADAYSLYTGDGSIANGWPAMTQWISFQAMFDANKPLIKQACSNFGLPTGSDTTEAEIGDLWNAIQFVAATTGVDHRFIFAVIMQESHGCVRIWTTNNGVVNPGLMQDHDGGYTCNTGTQSAPQMINPCPGDQIHGMIADGVGGTAAGDGLAGTLNAVVGRALGAGFSADGSSAQIHYQGARMYNSGSVDYNALENGLGSTNCYASDIANWLTGWLGGMGAQSTCA